MVDDLGALKPTLFIGVPRVFDRIYSKVMAGIREAGGLKKALFNFGFKRKLHFLQAGKKQHQVRRAPGVWQLK